ncbi:unnamed protein product [Durusdinium trenchii]|uniref:Uncharacterized protein n=1 Tax=Durusdinium trenchii TaxID=1381693 RepID=A0ABP0T0L0_9DINO
MVHKVGVATVLGGACVLAGLFHWSNLALTPRLQVKRCSTKSPREVEGLSLAKLEGLAQDLERRYIQTGKLKGGVLAVVRAGKVVGIWETVHCSLNPAAHQKHSRFGESSLL